MTFRKLLLLLLPFALLSACLDSTGPEFEEYDNTADLEYLEENAKRDGVTVTESGLQYRITKDSEGIKPTENSAVVFDFIGKFVDGDEFNNTFEGELPFTSNLVPFPQGALPQGLVEGIQLMSLGSTYEFTLPPDIAYGDRPPQGFPPGAVIIFELELLHSSNYDTVFLDENAQNEEVTVTESGLQYRIIEEGSGAVPESDSSVNVEYTGTFIYGETFDTSRNTDGPATFNVGQVIEGFSEGLQLMQEGARYELFIPGEIAYGNQPPPNSPIYPNATLIFDVELISIND